MVKFLYAGEINCCEEIDSIDILENLHDIFGFPRNLSLENPNQSNDVCIFLGKVLSMDKSCSKMHDFDQN